MVSIKLQNKRKKILEREAVCIFCAKSHHRDLFTVFNLSENKFCRIEMLYSFGIL